MRIRWTPAAAADLERFSNYLKSRHPRYRQPTMLKLYQAINSLKEWPRAWPPWARGRDPRAIISPYALCCCVPRDRSIEVLRIYHAAQDRS